MVYLFDTVAVVVVVVEHIYPPHIHGDVVAAFVPNPPNAGAAFCAVVVAVDTPIGAASVGGCDDATATAAAVDAGVPNDKPSDGALYWFMDIPNNEH